LGEGIDARCRGGVVYQYLACGASGGDTSLAAFLDLIVVFVLAIFPVLLATSAFYIWRLSQRAGDIAFSCCMILQGLLLALA
jgi:hypothetical protein